MSRCHGKEGFSVSDERKEALEYIIRNKQIRCVFQPIISLKDGNVLGHEALSRITCESEIASPDMMFNLAGEFNRLWDLELLCRTKALEAAYRFMIPPYSKKLFLNVNPNIMHDENFKKGFTREFLMQYHVEPQNVIFEITERNVILDMGGFLSTIDHYRSQDYKIAIDDAGAGYSGLNLISDVNPSYIKLDMKLIRDINTDKLKYALVKGMVELSKTANINLIAEGIESKEELETLIVLGVQYGQGYFIQMPSSELEDIADVVISTIIITQYKLQHAYINNSAYYAIKSLSAYTGIVSTQVTADFVYNIFQQNSNFFGLCIVENGTTQGIITNEKLSRKMSGHYGFSLYQNKPITELMDRDFLSVEYDTPINTVSYMAMNRKNESLYDFIVVTEEGKYIGTVTIKDLLQKKTEIDVDNAKHLNPLTGLSGNLIIEERLKFCLQSNTKFSIAYIDIDNFKAYNDVYGFEYGDIIIKLLANILRGSIAEEQFVGHIGGDDFVAIIDEYVTDSYFDAIVHQFETEVLRFYHTGDIQNGYIRTVNRHGEVEQYPLLTLTAVVETNQQHYSDVFELTKLLAKRKQEKKQSKLSMK